MVSWRLRCKGTALHDLLGVWALAWTWGPMLGALAVFRRWPSPWTFALAFVVVGIRQNALFIVTHETWHFHLFRVRRVNEIVGAWLAAYPMILPFYNNRKLHWDHHRHVGEPSDPDRFTWDWPIEQRWRFLRELVWLGTGLPFVLTAARVVLRLSPPKPAPGRPPRPSFGGGGGIGELAKIAVSHLVILGIFTATIGWPFYFALWLAPVITIGPVVLELRQFLEHRHGRLLVYRAGPIERWIFGCFNFHLHAFHHAFASEPWFCIPAIEATARRKEPDIVDMKSYAGELFAYVRGRDTVADPSSPVHEREAGD